MTGKILANYVINKGNMLVLLNLQQMGLIFENHIKKLICLPQKSKVCSSREFQESLIKCYYACLFIPCMNLYYSIIRLFYHLIFSRITFFAVAVMFFHAKVMMQLHGEKSS